MAPTRRALVLAAGLVPVGALPAFFGGALWTVWAGAGLALLLGGALDRALALPPRRLRAAVTVPDALFIGESDPCAVELGAPGRRRPTTVEALLDLSPDLSPAPARTVEVRGVGRTEFRLEPRRRGTARVGALWLRWRGPLGLVELRRRDAVDRPVSVLPNVRAVRRTALRFRSEREFRLGLKVERYLGDGSEFDALHEYAPGWDPRALDWKASARHRKLLVQEFRAERNHQVVVAIDTGHRMSEPIEGLPRLDHAVNAALQLVWCTLKSGDRVGFYAFDARPGAWLPPEAGVRAFGRVQRATAALAYGTAETNFTLGLLELTRSLRRRALVVLFTDFVDVAAADLMLENVGRLARRHRVLFVTLRDPELAALAGAEPRSLLDLHRAVVAADLEREREVVLARLRRLGISIVDAAPAAFAPRLVQRYLEIKRRELVG